MGASPVKLLEGNIKSLVVHIPFTRLGTDPVILELDGLQIKVQTKDRQKSKNLKDIEAEIKATKQKMIKEFEDSIGKRILDINDSTQDEAMFSEFTLSSSQTATQGTSGYFGRLIKKIVKNIHANIKNVKFAIVH